MVMMKVFNYYINWEEIETEKKEDRKFMEMLYDASLQQHVVRDNTGGE